MQNVQRLISDETGRVVRYAEVRTLGGLNFRIAANWFVLAAGGIENSRLLLLSNSVVREGLGNQNDTVGRYFMEHPNFDTVGCV